jgi:hypothetical protein
MRMVCMVCGMTVRGSSHGNDAVWMYGWMDGWSGWLDDMTIWPDDGWTCTGVFLFIRHRENVGQLGDSQVKPIAELVTEGREGGRWTSS